MHGKATTIEHDGRTIFAGLASPLKVGRYHSLVVDEQLPDCLEATAHGGGVLMGLRHRELPAEGVQFHPESVLTDEGKKLLANFLGLDVKRMAYMRKTICALDVSEKTSPHPKLAGQLMPNPILTRAIDAVASRRDLSQQEAAEVLAEIMHGEVSETQIAALSDRAAHKGGDG